MSRLLFHTQKFYNEAMHIKIKNPTLHDLLVQLASLSFLLAIVLVGIIVVSDSITVTWEPLVEFFNYVKQKNGLFTAGFCAFVICMAPVGIIATFIKWWEKRNRWLTPFTVYALDFGPDGVTVYTKQNTQFLPYKQTDFKIIAKVVSLARHTAVKDLTLTLLCQDYLVEVSHQCTSIKLLYRLADLHSHFKTFSFVCKTSSSNDIEQLSLANFLKKQVDNQIRYGLHYNCREDVDYFIRVLISLPWGVLGITLVWVLCVFGPNPFRFFWGWVLLLVGAGLVTLNIILLYNNVIKDKLTEGKLKQLRGK